MAEPYKFDPQVWGANRLFRADQWQAIKRHLIAGKSQQEAYDLVFGTEPNTAPVEDSELPPSAP